MVCCLHRRDYRALPRGLAQGIRGPAVPPDPALTAPSDSSAQYPPGTQIPSEHELSAELTVSRVTLREALRELVRENLLVKVQGKGTFVAPNPPKRLAPVRYTGFLEELQERVRKLRVTTSTMAQVPATPELKKALAARRCRDRS